MPEFHQVTDPAAAIARAKSDAAAHKAAREAPMNAAKIHGDASKAAERAAESTATARDYTTATQYTYQRPPGLAFESRSGCPIGASAAQSNDVVHLGEAVTTSIAVAELRGFIEKGPNGWQLTSRGKELMRPRPPSLVGVDHLRVGVDGIEESDGQAEGPEQHEYTSNNNNNDGDSGTTDHDQDTEQSEAVAKAAEILQEVPDRVLAQQASRAVLGEGIDVATVAADLGISEDEATERAAAVVNGYQTEAAEYLAAVHGIKEPDEFVAWAQTERPTEFQGAMFGQVRGGQLEEYDSLARDFASASAKLDALDLARFEGSHDVEGHDEPAQVWSEDGAFWFHHPAIGTLSLREALLRKIAQPQ